MAVYVIDFESGQIRQLVAGANVTFTIGSGTFTVSASSGASSLAALTDVAIASPQDNEILTYDAATSKWNNKPDVLRPEEEEQVWFRAR